MSQSQPMPTPGSGASGAPEVRTVAAGQGWTWVVAGFEMFKKQAGLWVAIGLLLFVILFVLAVIPILGSIATVLLMPVFAGGLMLACRSQAQGGPLEIAQLFAGFKHRTSELLIVGALGFAATIVVMVPVLLITGGGAFLGASRGDAAGVAMIGGTFLLGLLVALALSIPLYMALWFAPALVALRGVAPVEALKLSFKACLQNFVPFLVYGVVLLVLGIVATVPLGLGWLVLGPVTIASIYVSYREIYGEN